MMTTDTKPAPLAPEVVARIDDALEGARKAIVQAMVDGDPADVMVQQRTADGSQAFHCRLMPPPPPVRPAAEPDEATRAAFSALRDLTDEQRELVLCWFCPGCWRYVGPGDSCNCERDE